MILRLLWILTIGGACVGGFVVVLQVVASAPQGALTTFGVACAVIPYCLARAVAELKQMDKNPPA